MLIALHLTLITDSSNVIATSSNVVHDETRLNTNKDGGSKQSYVERGRHNLRIRHDIHSSVIESNTKKQDADDRLDVILKSIVDNRRQKIPGAQSSLNNSNPNMTIQRRHRERKLTNSHICKWHADQTNRDGCSNNDDINESWLDIDIYELMFSDSSQECCDTFFSGMECNVYVDPSCESGTKGDDGDNSNGGGGEEDDTPPCLGWHPTQTGCTDTTSYPTQWTDEKVVHHMFAATAEECCELHFPGGDCVTVHTGECDESDGGGGGGGGKAPCAAPGWHADSVMRDGCSNGLNCEFFFQYYIFWLCVNFFSMFMEV